MNTSNSEITKEFPEGKESYCPRCYFEDDITVLRKGCKHATVDTTQKLEQFRAEVEVLINKLSLENLSDTPDYIIAQYLTESLMSYNRACYANRIRENGGGYEKVPII